MCPSQMSRVSCERARESGQLGGMQVPWPRNSVLGCSRPRRLVSTWGNSAWVLLTLKYCKRRDFLTPVPGQYDYRKQPIHNKRNHVPFCSVLSDLPKTHVPETVVFVENTVLRGGSLTWVRFGVLCALAKLRHCAFPKTILFKKKKKDMQFKYSVCP